MGNIDNKNRDLEDTFGLLEPDIEFVSSQAAKDKVKAGGDWHGKSSWSDLEFGGSARRYSDSATVCTQNTMINAERGLSMSTIYLGGRRGSAVSTFSTDDKVTLKIDDSQDEVHVGDPMVSKAWELD